MSSTPKRQQEDGTYPSGSKRAHGEATLFPTHSGRLTQSSSNEYHQPIDQAHAGRLGKFPRIESRETDKGSPLLTAYRVSSCVESSPDHHNGSDTRPELRDMREGRETKVVAREAKVDFRCLPPEARIEPHVAKGEKEVTWDEKEKRHEKDSLGDVKIEGKTEKDCFLAGNAHVSWKEQREQYHRAKRYFESSTEGFDVWTKSHGSLHDEHGKEKGPLISDKRDHVQAHEVVGENKFDLKGDEKLKDREKKKEDKFKDWRERDKNRNDQRNSSLLSDGTNTEQRELTREDKETEKWDKENKNQKDKEKLNERDKDHVKKERPRANEEGLYVAKEMVNVPQKVSEQESTEQMRLNESGRDAKDKKGEKEENVEGDQSEKSGKDCDKESDDGCNGLDEASEKDRDGFIYGVQQRKRMLRPRGTQQSANKECRFRLRARERDGCQGKLDVASVIYKPGECMQELAKLWKDFETQASNNQTSQNSQTFQSSPTLEIRIPAEYVTATNRQVRGGQLWGTDVYTDDSDLVAVLMHTGYCRPTASTPPSAVQELCATIRVLPPRDSYASTLRNNVRSRAWGAAIGCSYCVERCYIVKKGGGTIDLEPCLTHSSAVEPTVAPVAVERTMTTRAAASNALRNQRFVREVTVQYNLCNEPWLKYSITVVADKGLKKSSFTSARLKKGEILYVETHKNRYELCYNGEKVISNSQTGESESQKLHNFSCHDKHLADRDNVIDVFRWSRCKRPLPQSITKCIGIPLPPEHLEVLEDSLDWEDIEWSQMGVWIAGKEYPLARVHFFSPN